MCLGGNKGMFTERLNRRETVCSFEDLETESKCLQKVLCY
jgi:hypothetical protein